MGLSKSTRSRLATYAIGALLGSALQFPLYDCSDLPMLSFPAGAAPIFVALATIEAVYRVAVSSRQVAARLGSGLGVGVAGSVGVLLLGQLTVATHLCG